MAYSAGMLRDRCVILNRTEARPGAYGLDSDGVDFAPAATVWASVEWARGKAALNAGAVDAYAVRMVRMRWTPLVTERSRISHEGRVWQILPETFQSDRQGNSVQFLMQQLVTQDGAQPVR